MKNISICNKEVLAYVDRGGLGFEMLTMLQ